MADRSISIAIEARVQGFISGMRTAQQATTDLANRVQGFARDNEQHLDRVGKAGLVMGGGLLAGVALAVKSFMEFDAAMSEVQSSTHETEANMDLLREAAINAGAATAFSAKEAAQGIDELAKAGVATKDILAGGLTGALNLAAAGSLGVGEAAEIAATALTQFKLSGDKVPHLADLLAAGAGKAQGSVQDMGMALKQTGLVAASTGLSIEETTGGLAAFASAGLIGSDAGTSFKSMLQRLTPQSKEAEEKMRELGISAYDSQGQFVGLAKFSENLKTSMQELTPEARNAAMGVIFGSDAVRAANVLYEQGAEGIAEWTDKVNDSGYAIITARTKTDNLAGDLERLGGSFDSVLIKGGGAAAETLRGIVQGLEDLVDSVGKIPAPMLQFSVSAAGVIGAVVLLGGGLLTVLPRLVEFRASMAALATTAPGAARGIGAVGKAAGGALVTLLALQAASAVFTEKKTKSTEEYGAALLKVSNAGKLAKSSDLDSIFQNLGKAFGEDIVKVNNLSDAVSRLSNQTFNDAGNKFFEGFTNFLGLPKGEIGQLEDSLKGLGEEMGNLAKNGAGETAAKSFSLLTKEFEKNGKGAKEALEYVPGYKDALLGLANQAGVTLSEQELLDFALGKVPASMSAAAGATETYISKTGEARPVTEEMAKALEEVGISAEGAITDIDAFGRSLFAAGLLSLSASDASIAYQDAIDKMTESVKTNGTTLDINTEKGRANQSAFNGLAQAAISAAEATAEETLKTQGSAAAQAQLQGSLRTSYDDLVRAAGQLGKTGDEADTMARKALGIPKNVNIDAWIADHASSTLEGIRGKADSLNGKTVTLYAQADISAAQAALDHLKANSMITANQYASGNAYRANGGIINYLAGGGYPRFVPRGTDTVPAMLTPGEFVVTREATVANRPVLEAMNAGYKYAPAAAPQMTVSMKSDAPQAPLQMTGTLVMDSGEVLGVFHGIAVQAVNAGLNGVASTVGGRSR
jgi:TP901 family phage tail tape measure protein